MLRTAKTRVRGDIRDCTAAVWRLVRHLAAGPSLKHKLSFSGLEFHAVTEGAGNVALSHWPDQDKIRVGTKHSDHLIAQEFGKKNWYESYSVQICEVKRHDNSLT